MTINRFLLEIIKELKSDKSNEYRNLNILNNNFSTSMQMLKNDKISLSNLTPVKQFLPSLLVQ